MNYKQHKDIKIPAFLSHWQDYSYRNDACAHSAYEVGEGFVRIWVERDAPEDRDSMARGKYSVQFCPDDQVSEDMVELYNGEDADIAALWAHAAEIVVCGPDEDDDPRCGGYGQAYPRVGCHNVQIGFTPEYLTTIYRNN